MSRPLALYEVPDTVMTQEISRAQLQRLMDEAWQGVKRTSGALKSLSKCCFMRCCFILKLFDACSQGERPLFGTRNGCQAGSKIALNYIVVISRNGPVIIVI